MQKLKFFIFFGTFLILFLGLGISTILIYKNMNLSPEFTKIDIKSDIKKTKQDFLLPSWVIDMAMLKKKDYALAAENILLSLDSDFKNPTQLVLKSSDFHSLLRVREILENLLIKYTFIDISNSPLIYLSADEPVLKRLEKSLKNHQISASLKEIPL